jgi:hypothetical protein
VMDLSRRRRGCATHATGRVPWRFAS